MTKKTLNKIFQGSVIDTKELTADEKMAVYACLARFGMPQSTAYHRLFVIGFSAWEIMGVTHIRDEFLATSVCCVDDNGTEDPGSRGYGYVLSLDPDYDNSQFFDMLVKLKLGKKFTDYMAERGMQSQMTVRSRFRANDWKEWELKGIKAILEELNR